MEILFFSLKKECPKFAFVLHLPNPNFFIFREKDNTLRK